MKILLGSLQKAGKYELAVYVKGEQKPLSEKKTFVVNPELKVSSFNASVDSEDAYIGCGINLSAKAVGGSKRYQYQFSYIDSQGYTDRLVYFQYINDSNVNAPNIYVMRDSYSIALVPFMKDSFYKSTYNWTWSFSKEDILNSEADVVMVVVAERNLRNYVNNKAVSD